MTHYYSEKQESRLELKKIKVHVKGTDIELFSASGIFSKDELDKGTRLLIENAVIGDSILDLGCGNGIVGISLKILNPAASVLMTDINERAVMIAKKNVFLHSLQGISARKSDSFSNIPERFDTILLNPPQTAGRDLCYRMIEEAKSHLNENGIFQLVARHNKGGETLSNKMEEVFGNVKTIAKGSGFRVYLSSI